MKFQDKVVVVTGAAAGFGREIAERFAANGAAVVVSDIDQENGEAVAAGIVDSGGKARFVAADVSSAAQVAALLTAAKESYGGLDILINNAGFPHLVQPLWELSEEDYDRQFAVNTKGTFLGCKYAIPLMIERGGGAIVNTASIGAIKPRPGITAYNATKGAVNTMTRGLAGEVGALNIRVNAVNPVASETGFVKNALGTDSWTEEQRELIESTIPLGRASTPADVADAVLFLASDDAKYLSGVCLPVDGGYSSS